MKTNNSTKKSIYVLFILALLGVNRLCAQDSNIEIKIESASVSINGVNDGKIVVEVRGDNPEFIYRLFDNAPWDDGKVLQISEPTSEKSYTFTNLTAGKYMVCVTDNVKVTRCEYAAVKEE